MHLMHGDVTEKIIATSFEVHRVLGYGLLEMVYQRALQVELIRNGKLAQIAQKMPVVYKGVNVGKYVPDLLVNEVVIVEVKVAKQLDPRDKRNCSMN